MTHLLLLIALSAIVVANHDLQAVSTAEDYEIFKVALQHIFPNGGPPLRDQTYIRKGPLSPEGFFLPHTSEDLLANFHSRNEKSARIETGKLHLLFRLLERDEEKNLCLGQVCPIAFVSRPGFNLSHRQALIIVGTS